MDEKKLFREVQAGKLFCIVALPGAVGMIFSTLYQIFDGIFVANLLGPVDFAALNLAFPFVIINFALADLVGVGSSVQIAIHLGAGEQEKADNLFSMAVLLLFLTGLVSGLLLIILAPMLFSMLGAEGELHAKATGFLRAYALFSPITCSMFAVDNFLKICAKVKRSMVLNIVMSVLVVVLELVFLKVLGLGLNASAYAASISMSLIVLIALIPFAMGRMSLKFRRIRFDFNDIRKICASGTPSFLNNIAGRLVAILMNAELLRLGGENAVSTYGILMYVDTIIFPLMYGFSDALQPAIGYNTGLGDMKRVSAIARTGYVANIILSAFAFLTIMSVPDFLVRLFSSGADDGLTLMALRALRLFSITYLFRWFPFFSQSYLNAIGQSGRSTLLSIFSAFLFPLTLLYLLLPLGLDGLWLNSGINNLLSMLLSAFLLSRALKGISCRRE